MSTEAVDRRAENGSAIVRAITEFANALGMESTAEGVEENEQLAELRSHGCSAVQGFLFSEPLSGDAVDLLLGKGGTAVQAERAVA